MTFMRRTFSKELSAEDVSWGTSLICTVGFISRWAPWCGLPITSLAMISECGHSTYLVGVRSTVSMGHARVGTL
jgi:hypothetical protein